MTNDRFHFRATMLTSICACLAATGVTFEAQAQVACDSYYRPTFVLKAGKLNPPAPVVAKPAKGVAMHEANFGTCLVRATAHATEAPQPMARTDYSRRQAFNADNTYFIISSPDGWWHLYDGKTLAYIRKLSPRIPNPSTPAEFHLAGDAEPQWDAVNPNVLYYIPRNGGTKLLKLDVRTNTYAIAANFAGRLPSWASSAEHIWTKSEGSPSANSRYWGFQVENAAFGLLGYITWDLQTNSLIGSRASTSRPDHTSMSPSGRWFVTSDDATGTWAWSPNFTTKKKLLNKSEHSDLAIGADGHDYYVSIDYQSNAGDVFMADIDACPSVPASATTAPLCPRTVLWQNYINGAASAVHFSGKAFSKPGWVVMSTYATSKSRDGTWPWYTDKVFAVQMKANPLIYPLAYIRRGDSDSYFTEPHATVSRDFTRVTYNSNWGKGKQLDGTGEDIDAYIIRLPANVLGVTATTTAPLTVSRFGRVDTTQRAAGSPLPMPIRLGRR